jgi:heme iron utilization protein
MNTQTANKEDIEDALQTNNLAVLATEGNGQPHASFIAVTPMDDLEHLIFATYRNTRKYNNLINNGKVAILFENRSTKSLSQHDIMVLTAYGHAIEVDNAISDAPLQTHLLRHPELECFLLSVDCAIFMVKVNAYEVVRGIDDIKSWNIPD